MQERHTVAFHTLGCKLNFSETSTISRSLVDGGFEVIPFEQGADVYVINTCSVTHNADKECRKLVRRALSYSPGAFIAIIGCYAQLKPQEIAQIDGVDLVLGADEKFNLAYYLKQSDELIPIRSNELAQIHACEINDVDFFVDAYSFGERTRVFLKVQDGCDYQCSFCTIPLARGKSRSDTIANVMENVEQISKLGAKEIVLTGINLGDFNDPSGNQSSSSFLNLLQTIERSKLIDRIRISSIEPNLLSKEIIELVAASNVIMPHFHIPLQSGSNKILKRMRRRYQRELYTERVDHILTTMQHACIGVDVIVGFPGETHEDFLDTYNYLNELDISYLHVFTYSERDNTDAVDLDEVVPMAERRVRSKMLRNLSIKKRRKFYADHLGDVYNVLFESEDKDGWIHGFTENYIKVKFPFDINKTNKIVQCRLTSMSDDGLVLGKAVEKFVHKKNKAVPVPVMIQS